MRDSVESDTLQIGPEGVAVLPLAGDTRLGGLAGSAVQDTIRARLAPYIKPNLVEAVLLRRVRVVGDLNKPGVYFLDRTATIRDAVATANGVSEIGHDKKASLVRNGTVTAFADWRTDPRTDTPLESGDEIIVERLSWLSRNAITLVTGTSVLASIIFTIVRK